MSANQANRKKRIKNIPETVGYDSTERKKTKALLDEKQRELDCILDSSPTLIFYKDRKGKFIKANRAFTEALKLSKEQILGKTVFDLYSAEIAQRMANDDLVVLKSKHPKIGIVESYESPTGLRWILTNKIPLFDEKNSVTGLIGFSEDITEHKNLEELLEESKKKYQDLIETTPDFIWEMDALGRYTYCSPQIEKLWGFKPSEMIGKTPFDIMPTSEKEKVFAVFREISKSPKSFSGLETTAYDSQGRLIFLEISGIPFFDQNQRLLGFRGISRDITQRKNLEKQLKDKERLAIIGTTAGMVGHDIRNPLQAIVGDTFLLRLDLNSSPDSDSKESMVECLDSIDKNVEYINKIVQDLQDYSKPIVLILRETDFESVLQDVLGEKTIPASIDASFVIQRGTNKIVTDPLLLKRILTNLVNNAVQAMPEGGKLVIQIYKKACNIAITVQDTGLGIPDEIKPKLFTPLFTTKSKGQGFGLAVVKRMTEVLGGTVSFESEKDKGTKFVIELPIKE